MNIDEIKRCATYLLDEAENAASGGQSIPEPKLVALSGCLNRVFRGRTLAESSKAVADYKVFICEEEAAKKPGYTALQTQKRASGVWVNGGDTSSTSQKKKVLNFWAFSPGIAMEDLKKLGVRSIILTSGTLSPMASFKEDMKLPFPVQLENKHVIEDKQIWVGCITTGISGKQLNSSFRVRETPEYKDEVGGSILNIVRTMAGQGGTGTIGSGMPPGPELKGGILVFFPSYGVMDNCVERWQATGLLEKLRNVGGEVVVEPKGSGTASVSARDKGGGYRDKDRPIAGRQRDRWSESSTTDASTAGFGFASTSSTKIMDEDDGTLGGGGGGGASLGGVIKEFEATLASRGRCVLLAVCR